MEKEGYHIFLIGKKGHAEVIGTLGRLSSEKSVFVIEKKEDIPQKLDKVGVAMQTTLSQDETLALLKYIQTLYPNAILENGICLATTERQAAVKASSCSTVLVVGDTHSSNAKRLVEVAKASGKKAYLIETAEDLLGGGFKRTCWNYRGSFCSRKYGSDSSKKTNSILGSHFFVFFVKLKRILATSANM